MQRRKDAKRRWEEFVNDYITGWFDTDRAKTLSAMRLLCERMPDDYKARIPLGLIVFAPSTAVVGRTYHLCHPAGDEDRESEFIYLSPFLEQRTQEYVNSTVAHEFAHAILDRPDDDRDDAQCEKEADALIEEWGYRAAYSFPMKRS